MKTLIMQREDYEAISAGVVTSVTRLLNVPHLTMNYTLREVTKSSHSYLAYNRDMIPCPVKPAYERGDAVCICEPVARSRELGTVYPWDYPDGESPIQSHLPLQYMKPSDARLVIFIEKVTALRLSEIDDEMAFRQGVWQGEDGDFRAWSKGGYQLSQPTPVAALIQAFLHRQNLPPKDYWVWHYQFTVIRQKRLRNATRNEWQPAFP